MKGTSRRVQISSLGIIRHYKEIMLICSGPFRLTVLKLIFGSLISRFFDTWLFRISISILKSRQDSPRLTDTAQRRHCQLVAIWSLIDSTYLRPILISVRMASGQAKNRTVGSHFYTGCRNLRIPSASFQHLSTWYLSDNFISVLNRVG